MPDKDPRDAVLSCTSLPTPPTIAVQLLELTRDPDVSLAEIATLVQADQALASKVLKLVNSSMYGLSKPCSSIERAMGFIGLNTVKSLVLGFSLVDSTQGVGTDDERFDVDGYWHRVITSAAGTRVIAERVSICDPDNAFTAALFQDLGVLASYISLQGEYTKVYQEAGQDHESLQEKELKALGFHHAEIGAELALQWKLPEFLADCIRFHHDVDDAPEQVSSTCRAVSLGRLAGVALSQSSPEAIEKLTTELCERYDASPEHIEPLLNSIASAAKEMGKMFEKKVDVETDIGALLAQAQEQQLFVQASTDREATALRERTVELETEVSIDGLTGALNRKRLNQDLAVLEKFSQDGEKTFGIMFCDGDKFKLVNDTFGHQSGDEVLMEMSRRLSESIGNSGTLYRYGGEEFVALFPGASLQRAAELAENARKAVEITGFDLSESGGPEDHRVTISAGVACWSPESAATAEQVLHWADVAVYKAKEAGRNRIEVHHDTTSNFESSMSVQDKAPQDACERPRLLLIEDDPLAATLVRVVLTKRLGFDVDWVTHGQLALDRLQCESTPLPVAVMSDVMLPDITGIEVTAAIRSFERTKNLPVLLVSASWTPEKRAEGVSAGADEVMDKALMVDNLPETLRNLFASINVACPAA